MLNAVEKEVTITSGKGNAKLYAVVTTDKGDSANIFADGSLRIRWESGRVTDVTPQAGLEFNPDDDVQKIIEVFTAADAVSEVHIAPTGFANEAALKDWFTSIGVVTQWYLVN
jgi:hypothetical protein